MAAIAEKPEKVNGRMAKKEKTAKGPETGSKMDALMDQNPNLKTAFQQIEKQFGEGSIMPLGGNCKKAHATAREVRACYGLEHTGVSPDSILIQKTARG